MELIQLLFLFASILVPAVSMTRDLKITYPNTPTPSPSFCKLPDHDLSCPCGSTLRAIIPYPSYSRLAPSLFTTYQNLTSCPNITALHLSIAEGRGCVVEIGACNFDFKGFSKKLNETHPRFPNITELRVLGYDFDDYRQWWDDRAKAGYDLTWHWEYTLWDYITMNGPSKQVFPPPPTQPEPLRKDYLGRNLQQWREVMEWSKLEVLEVREAGPGFFVKMAEPGALPRVRELTVAEATHRRIGMYWQIEEWKEREELWVDFIKNVNTASSAALASGGLSRDGTQDEDWQEVQGLEKLTLYGPISLQKFVEMLLPVHGSTLKELSLRQKQFNHSLGFTALEVLGSTSASSNIQNLTLDIPFNLTSRDWPYDLLAPLSRLASLQHLTLYLNPYPTPYSDRCVRDYSEMWFTYRNRPSLENRKFTFKLNEDTAYDLFVFLREEKRRNDGAELLDLRLEDADGNSVLCNVLDNDGKRKKEGKAWCSWQGWNEGIGWWEESSNAYGTNMYYDERVVDVQLAELQAEMEL